MIEGVKKGKNTPLTAETEKCYTMGVEAREGLITVMGQTERVAREGRKEIGYEKE